MLALPQLVLFLTECKRKKVVPNLVFAKIRTSYLFKDGGKREAEARRCYGREVLRSIIHNEYGERAKLIRVVYRNRKLMFKYTKEQYLFVKEQKTLTVRQEAQTSQRRLRRKVSRLCQVTHGYRVSCGKRNGSNNGMDVREGVSQLSDAS